MQEDVAWPGEWMRGVLTLCVLGVVAEGRTYGYAVAARLSEAGLGTVKGGTLYPILGRLENDGYVTSSWGAGESGPGRKFFEVTSAGHEHLAATSALWADFVGRAQSLLPGARVTTGPSGPGHLGEDPS